MTMLITGVSYDCSTRRYIFLQGMEKAYVYNDKTSTLDEIDGTDIFNEELLRKKLMEGVMEGIQTLAEKTRSTSLYD